MNVLSGVYPHGSYTGEIFSRVRNAGFKIFITPKKIGLVIIHQELALVPFLSIAENIFSAMSAPQTA